MKRCAVASVAVTVVLTITGCTGTDEPTNGGASPSSSAPGAPQSSMTFEEAHRKLPMDGTEGSPITWELSGVPDNEQLLAARRSLAFSYWLRGSADWSAIVPIGRFLYTERHYQEVLAPFATVTASENQSAGPLWVKAMGVEETGTDQVRVTFCTDIGWWHRKTEDTRRAREDRANLESYVVKHVQSDDAERRWLTDVQIDNAGDREQQYGAQCKQWARHQP